MLTRRELLKSLVSIALLPLLPTGHPQPNYMHGFRPGVAMWDTPLTSSEVHMLATSGITTGGVTSSYDSDGRVQHWQDGLPVIGSYSPYEKLVLGTHCR